MDYISSGVIRPIFRDNDLTEYEKVWEEAGNGLPGTNTHRWITDMVEKGIGTGSEVYKKLMSCEKIPFFKIVISRNFVLPVARSGEKTFELKTPDEMIELIAGKAVIMEKYDVSE